MFILLLFLYFFLQVYILYIMSLLWPHRNLCYFWPKKHGWAVLTSSFSKKKNMKVWSNLYTHSHLICYKCDFIYPNDLSLVCGMENNNGDLLQDPPLAHKRAICLIFSLVCMWWIFTFGQMSFVHGESWAGEKMRKQRGRHVNKWWFANGHWIINTVKSD